MATLKQRLHRKNASGTYDVIHMETTSDLVKRPDGTTTVEQSLTNVENTTSTHTNILAKCVQVSEEGVDDSIFMDADLLQGHPADYFAKTKDISILSNIVEHYVWEKHNIQVTYDVGDERTLTPSDGTRRLYKSYPIVYGNSYTYNEHTGEYTIVDAVRTTIEVYCNNHATTAGTYFQFTDDDMRDSLGSTCKNAVFKFNSPYSTSSVYVDANVYVWYRAVSKTETDIFLGLVSDPNPDTYPPIESDGYTYISLGQLGEKMQIEMGSYIGTGTYGYDNPTTLTFKFVPKFVAIWTTPYGIAPKSGGYGFIDGCIWVPNTDYQTIGGTYVTKFKLTDKTLSYYTQGTSANEQLNNTVTYYYLAIG